MMSRPRDVFTAEARGLGREAYITAAGLATSLGTVAVVWLGIALFGVDLSSLSVWIVVPVGAVAAGAVAASGYYIGAVRTETKPSLQLLVNMVLIGASTFLLIQYLAYRSARFDDGTSVASYLPFWDYYLQSLTQKRLIFRHNLSSPTEPVGSWGYVLEGIQFVGFMLGGLATYGYLADKPYCTQCSRYYRTKQLLHAPHLGEIDEYLAMRGLVLPDAQGAMRNVLGRQQLRAASLWVDTCPSCQRQQLRLEAHSENSTLTAAIYRLETRQITW